MKNYLKQFSHAFVMLLMGLCSMGVGMVVIGITGEKYSVFIRDLSVFFDGLLCVPIIKNAIQYKYKRFT